MNALPLLYTSGPTLTILTLKKITFYLTLCCLAAAILIHVLYGTDNEKRQNIQLWVGGTGFFGATLALLWTVASILILFHIAHYARIAAVDLKIIRVAATTFGDQSLKAVLSATEDLKMLRMTSTSFGDGLIDVISKFANQQITKS